MFFLSGFNVCSTSTTDEIAKNITQVIRKLNVDNDMPNVEPTGIDPEAEEYVVEEDVVIPQEDLVQTSSRNNVFPAENEEIDLPEEAASTFNHQRSNKLPIGRFPGFKFMSFVLRFFQRF